MDYILMLTLYSILFTSGVVRGVASHPTFFSFLYFHEIRFFCHMVLSRQRRKNWKNKCRLTPTIGKNFILKVRLEKKKIFVWKRCLQQLERLTLSLQVIYSRHSSLGWCPSSVVDFASRSVRSGVPWNSFLERWESPSYFGMFDSNPKELRFPY